MSKIADKYFKADEWKQIVDMGIFAPRCERLGYCPEKFSCGRKEKKK